MEFPERDELVIVIIRKIMPYGAFCVLKEYSNMEAFLHVSEVAPRWIKNIHEFVSEGQQHVAKVYRIDREKNQVDISLKRVSEDEKKRKLELARTEKRADKLLALAIKNSGLGLRQEEVREKIEKEFEDVWTALTEAVSGEEALDKVDLPEKLKAEIAEIAAKNIKKPTVEVTGKINLVCRGVEGVEDIKKVFSEKEEDVMVQYLGAPKYKITLTAPNYKDGEKRMDKVIKKIESRAHKLGCDFSFEWS